MRLVPERSPLPRLLVFPLLVASLWGWALLYWAPEMVLHLARCPLRDMTGIPCPTCGGTHVAVALARGQLAAALGTNPLVTLSALGLGLWSAYALAATIHRPLRRELLLEAGEKKAARFLAAAVLLAAWAWAIWRYGR